MIKAIKASLTFMTPKERGKWFFLAGLRALLSLLDLAGILAIGFVFTSTAIFLTSGSDPNRIVEFAGFQIPAVNAQTLPWVSAAVLFLFLAKALFSVFLTKLAAFFVATVEARSARTIAELAFGGDLSDARKRSREEMMFAIQGGSPAAFNVLLNAVNSFVTEAMLFILICIGFIFVDPWATLAAVLYFGLIAFVMQYFLGSLMTKAGQITAESAVAANTAISDLLSVFRELLVLGKREKYIDAIYKAREAAAESTAKQFYLNGMPRYIIEAALLVGVTLFVLAQALAGDIVNSAATISVFLSGGFRLTAALLPLQGALMTINSALPSARTAHEILSLVKGDEVARGPQTVSLVETQGFPKSASLNSPLGVEMFNVSFSYPDSDQPALKNASIKIEPGTQLALMGPSGAGKSTIADLLCGVLSPTAGTIVRTYLAPGSLGFAGPLGVSYVPQRPGLVSGTILDNVALGEDMDKVNRGQALEALKLANLAEMMAELPAGLDTPLGKLQDGLSGGQMQRLGLARALYTKPGLLVMDEATSALDAESEAEIQKALDSMRGKVTVVLIAHRLNTIQHADKVILMEAGQVKDSGTFKELIARNPSVDRIVDLMAVKKDY
jgi:ABC-type multidrug transport system fused ATPase/permease subunit